MSISLGIKHHIKFTAYLNIYTENNFCLEQQQILHSKELKFSEKIKGL